MGLPLPRTLCTMVWGQAVLWPGIPSLCLPYGPVPEPARPCDRASYNHPLSFKISLLGEDMVSERHSCLPPKSCRYGRVVTDSEVLLILKGMCSLFLESWLMMRLLEEQQ